MAAHRSIRYLAQFIEDAFNDLFRRPNEPLRKRLDGIYTLALINIELWRIERKLAQLTPVQANWWESRLRADFVRIIAESEER